MTNSLNIGLVGLGTVGIGTLKVIQENAQIIKQRAGMQLIVTAIAAKNKDLDRGISLDQFEWYDDLNQLVNSDGVDVLIELVGGSDGVAKEICQAALEAGKHVVTANKALIAEHGLELAQQAREKGVQLNFEAAVAGGIPIIKVLREGLVGNRINKVCGILNGTCNYILTKMRDTEHSFEDVLNEAQALGIAESDPTFDVAGIDTAHKLSILSSLAFGTRLNLDSVKIEGIENVTALDIRFARELGYGIKLLGIATLEDDGLSQYVQPCLVPADSSINQVQNTFNAVVVSGDFIDSLFLEGKGAGAGPTASAVVSDLVDIARGAKNYPFGVTLDALTEVKVTSTKNRYGSYYVRLTVLDQPGVLAEIASILGEKEVSIETVIQRGDASVQTVSIVMILHETYEHLIRAALEIISDLDIVVDQEKIFRIEKVE